MGFRRGGIEIDRHAFRFRCDNHIVVWEATRAGNGISFQLKPIVDAEPLVEVVLPGLGTPALPCWIAMHRDVRTSVRIRRVADFLHEALKRYCEGRPAASCETNSAERASPAIRQTTTSRIETAT
jgi:DNA-binding transcriptional LysR family regulator